MKKLVSCAYNMDTWCVELRYADGNMYSIDCTAVENEVARNMYERSELDYLIYNAPIGYAELVFNGDLKSYLRNVRSTDPWVTQDMRFKQAIIEYSLKHSVTSAAIRYKTSRQNTYRW